MRLEAFFDVNAPIFDDKHDSAVLSNVKSSVHEDVDAALRGVHGSVTGSEKGRCCSYHGCVGGHGADGVEPHAEVAEGEWSKRAYDANDAVLAGRIGGDARCFVEAIR